MSAANSLYRGIPYDGSYRVEIKSPGQTAPFWNIIIVNNAMPESGFKHEQIKWFKAETDRIKALYPTPPPAFIFQHVPLPQMATLRNAKGVKFEPVNFELGIPEGFTAIKQAGFVKAVFCGHDHYNNYAGELDGIRLQYLRASGWAAYGGDKVAKGGTLITVDATGPEPKFDAVTVMPDGSTVEFKDPV